MHGRILYYWVKTAQNKDCINVGYNSIFITRFYVFLVKITTDFYDHYIYLYKV